MEIIASVDEPEDAVKNLSDFLATSGGLTEAEAASCIYKLSR
ncbi:MAG: hypothetical protein MZV70_66960 [Desulfobacterales bacterium]|nr:hypothetical protein [Desulfobacterales bacterium]